MTVVPYDVIDRKFQSYYKGIFKYVFDKMFMFILFLGCEISMSSIWQSMMEPKIDTDELER